MLEEAASLDFEELLGALFVLYILGSMVSGFLRRGRQVRTSGDEPSSSGKGRPRFPQVLDMEELERRLRDLAEGRPPGQRDDPAPFGEREAGEGTETPVAAPPTPAGVPTEARKPRSVTVRVPAVVPAAADPDGWAADEDWDDVRDSSWPTMQHLPKEPAASRATALPPAVLSYMERGNPWQAAFVIKEVLGPPRALNRHRGRPRA